MTIANITNGESGSSVRASLNAVIDAVNALLPSSSPITYTGNPAGLGPMTFASGLLVNDEFFSGITITDTTTTANGVLTLDYGEIVAVTNSFGATYSALTSFTADNLQYMASFALTAPDLATLSLPSLKHFASFVVVSAVLTALNFPAIEFIGDIFIDSCPALATFSLGTGLILVEDNFVVIGAALDQASVDGVLVSLAALDGTGGTTLFENLDVDLSGGTSAMPGVTGLAAKAILEGRGCTVTVN